METLITFGEWLRQQRNELRLTRKAFAERIGCSVSALRKIEDGERRPSVQIAELMANSLNIPPEERTTFVKVARGEWDVERLARTLRAGASSQPTGNHLPILPTPMIGRRREVEGLGQLLHDPQCRLVSLVGPGGIGKTRLAIETAAHLQDAFMDGVFFVPLSTVNNTRFIVPVIADAIGFTFQSASHAEPKAQLFSYLKEKQALLLMDNLEQFLAEPGIEVLAELLASAPQVKLLATSRETLGLQGEWVYEVQGLPVPEIRAAEESGQDTAVELFFQRARRANVGFQATPQDYPAIVRICRLVDGMPLGIELAAAWVRVLSCAEIAGEIERDLDFLNVSSRDLPPRHRSMRAVFEHSWKLLSNEEQQVLLRLSEFQGGFRREAAEGVAGATLSALSSLVTKSLVRRREGDRYDLHELIRQFAAEQFAEFPEEQMATRGHHSQYYLMYLNQSEGRLHSSGQQETLVELAAEKDNFQVAWEWAITHGEFASIGKALRTFGMLYDTRGWWGEGIDILDRTIQALETAGEGSALDRTTQITLGRILAARAELASRIGQFELAGAMLERSLAVLRPLDEPWALVEPLTYLGGVIELTGEYTSALDLYSEGLAVARAAGDRWYAAMCFTLQTGLLGITQNLVDLETTHARFQTAVTDWRAIGDPRFTAIALIDLSVSALWLGRYDEAFAATEESVALSQSIGDRWGLGFAYRGLGMIAQTKGEHHQALDQFRKSLDTLRELGARQDVARVLADMGRSIFTLGNDAEAERTWRESIRIADETGGLFVLLEALAGLASVYARRGEQEHALELLLVVLEHSAVTKDTRERAAQLRSELEAQLTSQQKEAVMERVQAKTFEDFVEEVIT